MSDFLSKENLKNTLGDFWTQFFNEQTLLDGLCQGLSLHSRQLEQNNKELSQLTSIQNGPVDHVELWRPLRLVQDRTTGSFYPLKFDEEGAVFGESGTPPIHDRPFTFGENTDHRGLIPEEVIPKSVLFITDSIHNPGFVLVDGIDFTVRHGHVVFVDDINLNEEARATVDTDLYNDEDVYNLWGYYCTFDLEYVARQWGYLISFEHTSSKQYNAALWALWRARRFGLTADIFKDIIAIYLNCPRCISDNEVVEDIVKNPDQTTTIITTSNVYALTVTDTSAVAVGDVLSVGDFLGNKVSVIEPGKASFIRPAVEALPEYIDNKLLGDPGLVETSYIHFNTDVAASTIRKIPGVDYSPSYAVLTTSTGTHNVRVKEMYRFSANDYTLVLDTAMLPGPQTQVGFLQIYSTLGTPLFVEPYTGNMDPVSGVSNFITDKDDVLKINRLALTEVVDEMDRVVLISMFDDQESLEITQILQNLRFTDSRALSVTVYPSVSVYTDLPVEGESFSTIEKEQLLNYDMVILNTGSGVMSLLDENMDVQHGPSITDNEFIATIVSNLDRQIEAVKQDIAVLDNDLTWLLNYIHKDTRSYDEDWLYQLAGTRGTPLIDSRDGEIFYKYGLCSLLDSDTVKHHEINNKKKPKTLCIPVNPWSSSTGLGVVTKETNVPVYSKQIEVSGTRPRLETTLPSGVQYIYKVSSIVEHGA